MDWEGGGQSVRAATGKVFRDGELVVALHHTEGLSSPRGKCVASAGWDRH